MAKIVDVKYGLTNIKGGKPYKYVVNDNVKRGSVLMPVVTHYKSGKKFTTMGVVQHSYSLGSGNKNEMAKFNQDFEELKKKGIDLKVAETPSKAMTQALKTTNAKGQYVKTGLNGFSNKTTNANGDVIVGDETYQNKKPTTAVQTERQAVLSRETANESLLVQPSNNNDSYSEYYQKHLMNRKL